MVRPQFCACYGASCLNLASSIPIGFTEDQVSSHLAVLSYLSPAKNQVQSEDNTVLAFFHFNDLRIADCSLKIANTFDKCLNALNRAFINSADRVVQALIKLVFRSCSILHLGFYKGLARMNRYTHISDKFLDCFEFFIE